MKQAPEQQHFQRGFDSVRAFILAAGIVAGMGQTQGQEVVVPDDLSRFETMIAESIESHVKAVREAPSDFAAQQQLGLVYLANGAPVLAQRVFTECINLDPDSATAYYYRARSHYNQSKLSEAITDLKRAASLDQDFAPLQWRLGFWLLEDGQIEAAESRFNQAIDLDTDVLAGTIGLALVDLAKRNYQDAADRLEQNAAGGNVHPHVYHLLATAYRGLRRFNEAHQTGALASGQPPKYEDNLDDAIRRANTGYRALLDRSQQLLTHQQFDQSLAILDTLRSRFPEDPVVLNYYSYVYSRMGQIDRARDVLFEALRLDADHVATHLAISLAYERLGQNADAIKHAERAIELNPRFGPALLQRGRLALIQNDIPAGTQYLKRATECGIHEPQERIMYGRVLASQAKWREAATVFQQVVQNDPDEVQAWAGFAICLSQLGDQKTAQAALGRARQINPNDPFVQQARQMVESGRNR